MTKTRITFPDHVHFSMKQTVRIQDVNYRKHLGHDRLISMIHDARANFFEELGISELEDTPHGYILADLEVQYLDEAFFKDELLFEVSVSESSTRSCQIIYQVSKFTKEGNSKKIITKAKTGVVFFDYEKRQAIPLPTSLAKLNIPDSLECTAT